KPQLPPQDRLTQDLARYAAPQMTALSRPSVASLLLEPRVSGLPLGTATGFLVERAGVVFLVTNRHVVRKRHPSGAFPDEIKIVHNEAGKLGAWTERAEPLFGQDGSPLWLEHPGYRDMMDVVALPLTQTNGIQVYGYDPWNPGPPIAVAPSESVSTVGFPFGWTAGGA